MNVIRIKVIKNRDKMFVLKNENGIVGFLKLEDDAEDGDMVVLRGSNLTCEQLESAKPGEVQNF